VATAAHTEEDAPAEKRKRSPWTWPLIALVGLLLLVLAGTLIAFFVNRDPAPAPTTSSTTPSARPATPSGTPTSEPRTVNLDSLGLVGMNCDGAVQAATNAGLAATPVDGSPAPSADQVGTVESTDPARGNLQEGEPITITCFTEQTPIPAPGSGPTVTPNPAQPNSTATVSWAGFSCPSGTGSLSGYTVTIGGATFASDGSQQRSFGPGEQSAEIQVPATGSITATYVALCSGQGGQRESAPSPTSQVSIAPASTPTPSPTANG
jgi:serine/threonine-protein kinase